MFKGIILTLLVILVFMLAFLSLIFFCGLYSKKILINKCPYFLKLRSDSMTYNGLAILTPILLIVTVLISTLNTNGTLVFYSAYLATIGWLFTNLMSAKNSIRQHTITVLTQMRMSTEFMKNANQLQELLDKNIIIDKITFDSGNEATRNSIRYILNYLEFVAAGIRYGDLDEDLVKAAQRGMFINGFELCKPFIIHLNGKSNSTFEHLISTYQRWK